MMVRPASERRIQPVDGIGSGEVLLAKVRRAVSFPRVAPNDVEGVGAVVTGVALPKTAAATTLRTFRRCTASSYRIV